MDVIPVEIKQLFEYLKKSGITEKTIEDKLPKLSPKEIIDLYDGLLELSPRVLPESIVESNSIFDFNASPALSGTRFPCSSYNCRIKPVDQLARFAALYAEHVTIQYPIYDLRPSIENVRYVDEIILEEAIADFKILYSYRPLLESGIIQLMPHTFYICEALHRQEVEASKKLDKAVKNFTKNNLKKFQIKYRRGKENQPIVEIYGPEEFIGPHDIVIIEPSNEDKNFTKRRDSYWISNFIRDGVEGSLRTIFNNYSYITNYLPDVYILQYTSGSEFSELNNSLLVGLSHDLPFIHKVPLSRLIELRKKEGEAFRVYRDAIRLALKSVKSTTGNRSKEVFNDVVLPELNNIDKALRNSKKILTKNLTEDLFVSAGAIGMGLLSGLVSPTFGACLAAVGGINFASGLVKQASHVLSEPSNIRESSYYFLWKVRNKSIRRTKKR